MATAYCSITQDVSNNVQNFKGLTFFIISELIFTHLYAVINTFPEELAVFRREAGIYFSFPYFMSKVFVTASYNFAAEKLGNIDGCFQVPKCFLSPLLFLIIVRMQVDFPTNIYNFVEIYLVLSIGCVSATALGNFCTDDKHKMRLQYLTKPNWVGLTRVSFVYRTTKTVIGLCLSAALESKEYMELFIMPFDLLSMLMAGILVNVGTLPVYLVWLKYTSPFFYTYESVSILYWKLYWNPGEEFPKCNNYYTYGT